MFDVLLQEKLVRFDSLKEGQCFVSLGALGEIPKLFQVRGDEIGLFGIPYVCFNLDNKGVLGFHPAKGVARFAPDDLVLKVDTKELR